MRDIWKKPDPLESDIQGKIVKFAHRRGWFCQKVESKSARALMDLVAIRSGRTIWMEVKRSGESARRQQALRADEMRGYGAEVFLVDGLAQAQEILR